MPIDQEIKGRLDRSLRTVNPPSGRVDPVIRRARGLRRRHRAVGLVAAAAGFAIAIVPLALLSPLGRDTNQVPVSEPSRLFLAARLPIARGITDVASAFGVVWVTGVDRLARVDPSTDRVIEIDVPGTGDHSHVAVGEGSVWVTAPELRADGSRGNLVRIDPVTNTVAATIHLGGPIEDVAVGGGSVWVTLPDAGSSWVFRVDPATDRVVGKVEAPEGASRVIFGEGYVWVSSAWSGGSVTKIDPLTGQVADSFDVPAVQAVGDGALWGASGDSVLRIDPEAGDIEAKIDVPRAQDVALDGSTVWVLASPRSSDATLFEPIAGTASVSRIDASTDRTIGDPLALDDLQPIAFSTDERGAWVVDYYDGFLSLITPIAGLEATETTSTPSPDHPRGAAPVRPLKGILGAMLGSVRDASPAGWRFELIGDRLDGDWRLDGSADDGRGPGRLYVDVTTRAGMMEAHPCSDHEFRQGARCVERPLSNGDLLVLRAIVTGRGGMRTIDVVLIHPDGSGVAAETGNWTLTPQGGPVSQHELASPEVTRADPLYTVEELGRLVRLLDERVHACLEDGC
jgi:sugar lactone lactonase YvrE